jgi:hypothetical protein
MTPSQLFRDIATRHKIPEGEQINLLLNIVDNEPRLTALLAAFGEQLDGPQAAPLQQPVQQPVDSPSPQQPIQQDALPPTGAPAPLASIGDQATAYSAPAENLPPADTKPLEAFFDRDLAKQVMEHPQVAEVACTLNEAGNAMIIKMQSSVWEFYTSTLQNGEGDNDDIICGFYARFADGATAVVSIVNSKQGPFLDAFIILPEGAFPDQPNPSLPPRKDLAGDLIFEYPGGSKKFVRLIPEA